MDETKMIKYQSQHTLVAKRWGCSFVLAQSATALCTVPLYLFCGFLQLRGLGQALLALGWVAGWVWSFRLMARLDQDGSRTRR